MSFNLSELTKMFYSIGEVAEMFQVNSSLIRFWEKEFKEISPKKNQNGKRLFTQKDIETLSIIHNLVKEKGYTLHGAKDYLKHNKSAVKTKTEVIKKLELIKQRLEELKSKI